METFDVTPYRIVYENNPMAFAIVKLLLNELGHPSEAYVAYANPALEELLLRPKGSLEGASLAGLFLNPNIDWIDECISELDKKKPFRYTSYDKNVCKHISSVFYRVSQNHVALYIQDVTKIVEAERHETEEKKRKTDLLNSMGHDLRTPLNAIIGFTELALQSDSYDEEREHLTKIQTSAEYMQSVLNDCLDMNRIGNGKMKLFLEPASYEELMYGIRTLLLMRAEKKKVSLIFSQSAVNQRRIRIDVLHMQQVLMTLVDNAIKFTPEGGTIECITEALIPVDGYLPVNFIVRDNGIGMSQEFVDKQLFHEFEQENPDEGENQGTGLGLFIAQHLIRLMDGTITCKSEKGIGTEFQISMLCPIVSDIPEVLQIDEDDAVLRGKRVLICEDHKINAMLVGKMLEKKEVLSEWARNGKIGCEMFEEHETGYYDAIIMDLRMPVQNGVDAACHIRNLDREDSRKIPIIAMTASAFSEDLESCHKAGMNEYLAKPIEPEQMYMLLSKVFH